MLSWGSTRLIFKHRRIDGWLKIHVSGLPKPVTSGASLRACLYVLAERAFRAFPCSCAIAKRTRLKKLGSNLGDGVAKQDQENPLGPRKRALPQGFPGACSRH